MATNEQSAAWPLADSALAQEIQDLVQQVSVLLDVVKSI